MNNGNKTFEEELQDVKEIIDIFHKELDTAYEKIATGEHDIQKWHEMLLETLSNCFRISSDQLGKKGYCIDPDHMDQIINQFALRDEYTFSRWPSDNAKVQVKWVLRKKNKGVKSVLEIEYRVGNYIKFMCTDGWSMTAFGYEAFKSAVTCWADGCM